MVVFWILSALVSSFFSPAPVNNTSPVITSPSVQGVQVTNAPTPTITETPTPTVTIAPTNTPTPTLTPVPTKIIYKAPVYKYTPIPTSPPSSGLSNDNYYTNTQGNEVHSPAYSNSVPAGASAICGDGTYSFSQSRRGTCSSHGGVSQWL